MGSLIGFFKLVRTVLFVVTVFFLWNAALFAAKPFTVWDNVGTIPDLKTFYVDNTTNHEQNNNSYLYHGSADRTAPDALRFHGLRVNDLGISHVRYDQYYKGIPVWGQQLIFHRHLKNADKTPLLVTGMFALHIDQDVKTISPYYSVEKTLSFAQNHFQVYSGGNWTIVHPQVRLIIYLLQNADNTSIAKLAYTVTFFAAKGHIVEKPFFIIDANDEAIYQYWNDLQNDLVSIGQGPGGNEKSVTGNTYKFQYGPDSKPGWAQLGKFEVTREGTKCTMTNGYVEVASYKNQELAPPATHVTICYTPNQEKDYPTFFYDPCTSFNMTDKGEAPLNGGYSPNNDTMYGAVNTVKMYREEYGFPYPFGKNRVTRIYTHIKNLENAYALDAGEDLVGNKWHQQLGIGGGENDDYPFTDASTIAHELSHIFTNNNSDLIYSNQPGGVNEAYSDMAGLAFQDYIQRKDASWYPVRWSTGEMATKVTGRYKGDPMRYFDDPTKDHAHGGGSIGNAKDFVVGMDVHYSSGVYNKAFYLLSGLLAPSGAPATQGIKAAFTLFANANADYWAPNSGFYHAACGMLQEAADRGIDLAKINQAFRGVGMNPPCLLTNRYPSTEAKK